jgi:hypothetical protein
MVKRFGITGEIETIALIVIRTAGYGTVCPVVWEDGGSNPASYPIIKLPHQKSRHPVGMLYLLKHVK